MRVLVTGASGCGSSTLGRAVAEIWKCPYFDVDDYFWVPTIPPFKQERERTVRLALLLGTLAAAPSAVVGGSIVDWGVELEDSFSVIFFLALGEGGKDTGSPIHHERWLSSRTCPVLRIEGHLSHDERVARVLEAVGDIN